MNIRKATESDIHSIEDILYDAVLWMQKMNIPTLWTFENTRWTSLVKNYHIDDFYLYFLNNQPIGCMALTKTDHKYWPDVTPGNALFLHKLAVKKEASGLDISRELIDYAYHIAKSQSIPSIRLDCNADRTKLRLLYERNGFRCVDLFTTQTGYTLALYARKVE